MDPARLRSVPLVRHLAVMAAYGAAVAVGRQFLLPGTELSLVWPASGVALAAAYLLGLRYAASAGLAAVLAYLALDRVPWEALALGLGVGLAAALGAWALRRLAFRPSLTRMRDVLLLMVFGALLASAVSSLVSASVMYGAGQVHWKGFGSLWWFCWVADLMGALLVAPVVMTLGCRADPPAPARRLEPLALALAVAAAAWAVYGELLPADVAMAKPLSYIVFPLMMWAAVRADPWICAALLALNAAVALGFTGQGLGPFAQAGLGENMLSLSVHLAMLSVTTLVLGAAMGERRRIERELRRSESRYRLLVENQTDLVLKTDASGRVLFASPSVANTLGRPGADLLGRPFGELVRSLEGPSLEDCWQHLQAPPWGCELEQRVATARGPRWLAWAVQAVRNRRQQVTAVVVVGRDVTERRRAEEDAREYLQELAHMGRISAMGEMAAGLAHELNQPLCAVSSFSQAALRMVPADGDPQLRHAMQRTVANASRAAEIIRQMRAFVQGRQTELDMASVNDLVREVVGLTSGEARQAGVRLDTRLADGLPPVLVVRIQIHQVLVNLIRNAIEVLRRAPTVGAVIRVETREIDGGDLEVEVSDNGPGVPEDLQGRLFEPFVTGRREGMGLGLSISRSMIENHGGRLELVRAQGAAGATFRFRLPAAPAERGAAAG